MDEKLARGVARHYFNSITEEHSTASLARCFDHIAQAHINGYSKEKAARSFEKFVESSKNLPDVFPLAQFSQGKAVKRDFYIFLTALARRENYVSSKETEGVEEQIQFELNIVVSKRKKTQWLSRHLPFFISAHALRRVLERTPGAKDISPFTKAVPQVALNSVIWSYVLLALPFKNLTVVCPCEDGVFLGRSAPVVSDGAQNLGTFDRNGFKSSQGYNEFRVALAELAGGNLAAPTPSVDYRTFVSRNELRDDQAEVLDRMEREIEADFPVLADYIWQILLTSPALDIGCLTLKDDDLQRVSTVLQTLRGYVENEFQTVFSSSDVLPFSEYESLV